MTEINASREHGRRVPEDVAVAGYDDIELAQYFHPRLSSVRQPVEAGATVMAESLLALLAGHTPESTVLPTELIVRASSAAGC